MRSLASRSIWRRGGADEPPAGALRLGGARVASVGVGPKAALLDQAAATGLPVPLGVVLVDGAEPDAAIVDWLERIAPDGATWAVRSAFGAEDGSTSSLAGFFDSRLRVLTRDVAGVVADVRRSADRRAGSFRRDVLVMQMIDAHRAGVAFSEPGTYDDVVNVTTGTAERLVAGAEPGERVLVARLERADHGWARRLQRLLRDVRREFGDRPWDVEWADDGTSCWLVQLRPITRRIRRDEALTIANHAEILPALPSTLMTSVIAGAGPDLFAWYRRFDRSLPADRPFLEVVAGRPFINLSLLEDMLRHLGLPTRLVADSIGGPPDRDRPAAPLRILRRSPALVGMGLAQVTAVIRAKANQRRLAALGDGPIRSFGSAVDRLHEAYVGLVTGMFPLSSAIGPPLAVLRRTGTLLEHAARHRTVTAELADALDAVARGDATTRNAFLSRFGHRGIYESDIARPRYRDDPAVLVDAPARSAGSSPPPRTWRGRLTSPVWWLARPALAARESLRDQAMVGFAGIRDELVQLATDAVDDGRLPAVDDLWLLDVDEVRRLDDGWSITQEDAANRRRERDRLASLDPPSVVHRFDDPVTWSHDDRTGDRWRGLPLTAGVVRGAAWVLREPAERAPEGLDPRSTVLVARSIDAGWITTLASAGAVVIETGGDLSHGSILVREIGLPAVTNVRGITRAIRDGDLIEVDAGTGSVRRVAD
jgi:pyruvate,water dikinase